MTRAAWVLTLLSLFGGGCACGDECATPSCLLQARGDDGGPLQTCVTGAWRAYGDGGSCSPIPCRGDAGPPECGQTDCVKHSLTVFIPDSPGSASGTMFSTGFVASQTGGTWSNPLPPERWAYVVDGSELKTDGGAGPRTQFVTCTAQQLVLGEIALKTRSTQAESEALRALMLDGGTWSGLPLP